MSLCRAGLKIIRAHTFAFSCQLLSDEFNSRLLETVVCTLRNYLLLGEYISVLLRRVLAYSPALALLCLSYPPSLSFLTYFLVSFLDGRMDRPSSMRTGLREEFEMDSRLRKIESKLSMLQQNTNFFIEMLHNQKRSVHHVPAKIFVKFAVFLHFKFLPLCCRLFA